MMSRLNNRLHTSKAHAKNRMFHKTSEPSTPHPLPIRNVNKTVKPSEQDNTNQFPAKKIHQLSPMPPVNSRREHSTRVLPNTRDLRAEERKREAKRTAKLNENWGAKMKIFLQWSIGHRFSRSTFGRKIILR